MESFTRMVDHITCPPWQSYNFLWNGNAAAFFDFLFLSKLQFCLFGLLLTSPINDGIKVNNTFSSFHFSAFANANQTNIFLFFFSLPLPAFKHILKKHFLYHFFSPSSFLFFSLPPFATKHSVSILLKQWWLEESNG